MQEETKNEIVNTILKIISKEGLQNNTEDLVDVLAHLLFSIGSSLEDVNIGSSYEVLMRYAENPTLGNVLMAQAIHMKETWTEKERFKNESNDRQQRIVQGQTEEREETPTVCDLQGD